MFSRTQKLGVVILLLCNSFLSLFVWRPGDRIQVIDDSNEDWWKVRAVDFLEHTKLYLNKSHLET